jgi:hypothetical protein
LATHDRFLTSVGYPYVDELANAAYPLFLGAG